MHSLSQLACESTFVECSYRPWTQYSTLFCTMTSTRTSVAHCSALFCPTSSCVTLTMVTGLSRCIILPEHGNNGQRVSWKLKCDRVQHALSKHHWNTVPPFPENIHRDRHPDQHEHHHCHYHRDNYPLIIVCGSVCFADLPRSLWGGRCYLSTVFIYTQIYLDLESDNCILALCEVTRLFKNTETRTTPRASQKCQPR